MSFSEARTWCERGQQVQQVKDKCNAIIATLGLPGTDARVQGMVHVRQACNTLAAVAVKLQQNAEIPTYLPLLMTLLGVSDEKSLRSLLNDFNDNTKVSFLTVVQFALENSARQAVQAISKGSAPNGFKELAKRLVTVCHLSDPGHKLDLLLLPAYLRNTLHSNGIHTYPSITIVAGGEPYEFRQNVRVDCASWSHILFAVFHSLCIYEEAYLSPTVTAIKAIPAA